MTPKRQTDRHADLTSSIAAYTRVSERASYTENYVDEPARKDSLSQFTNVLPKADGRACTRLIKNGHSENN